MLTYNSVYCVVLIWRNTPEFSDIIITDTESSIDSLIALGVLYNKSYSPPVLPTDT